MELNTNDDVSDTGCRNLWSGKKSFQVTQHPSTAYKTYPGQKLTIDMEEIVAIDRNIQIVYLQLKILFCKVKLFIGSDPEC